MYFKQRHDTSSKSKYQRFVALTSGTTARLWTGWTAPPRPWLKKHWLQKKVLKRSFTTSEQFTFCKVKISICYNLPFGFMNKHDSNLVPHVFAKDKNSSITKEQFSQSFVLTFLVTKSSAGETLKEIMKYAKEKRFIKAKIFLLHFEEDLSLNDPLVKDPLLPMNNRTAQVETFFKHLKRWPWSNIRFLIVYFQCIRKYRDYTFDWWRWQQLDPVRYIL